MVSGHEREYDKWCSTAGTPGATSISTHYNSVARFCMSEQYMIVHALSEAAQSSITIRPRMYTPALLCVRVTLQVHMHMHPVAIAQVVEH